VSIPRVFHQVWVGPAPLPEEHVRYKQTWLKHNPGWELKVWTDENLDDDFRRPEVYERLRQPAERSDMLIFEVLYKYGGVYTDTDFECLRPIEPLLQGIDAFCSYSHADRLNNAIMGSVPGHPLIEEGIRAMRPRDTYGPVDKAGTGPFLLTELFVGRPEITLFPPELFYPRTPEGAKSAYGIHHEARSWKPPAELMKDAAEAKHRLAIARDELAALRREHELALRELEALRRGSTLSALAARVARAAVPRQAATRVRRKLGSRG
jgi:mannosyltransferase OCH1-like enzyme